MPHPELGRFSSQLLDLDAQPAPDVPDKKQYLPWRLKIMTPEEFYSLSDGEKLSEIQLAYLASFNVLAPTSHNTVPQRFSIDPETNSVTILADRKFILPESDKDGRQATIGFGTGLANMISAAKVLGLKAKVELMEENPETLKPYVSNQERFTHFIKVSFERSKIETADSGLLQAMKNRKMVRAESNPNEELPPELIQKIVELVITKYPTLHLNILNDKSSFIGKKTRDAIGYAQEGAMTYVINDTNFSRELGKFLVPDDDPSNIHMRPGEFGMNYESGLSLHRGLAGKIPLSPIHKQGFPKSERTIVDSANAIVVVSAKDDSPLQRLLTGQAVEDMALLLTENNWYISMHAATTEVDAGNKALRSALFFVNKQDKGRPTALFAVGRPLKPEDSKRNHAVRPMIEQLIFARD